MTTAVYKLSVDWSGNGVFTDTGEDVTARLQSLSWGYGRDYASQLRGRSTAGTLEAVLDNRSGDYSSFNSSSPLYGKILPGRPVKLETTAPSAVTLWRGFLDSITPKPSQHGDDKAILKAIGSLGQINQKQVSIPMQSSVTGDIAIGAILDDAGWSATARDLDTGKTTMERYWCDRLVTLSALQAVEDTEFGFIREQRDGDIAFENRHHRLVTPHTVSQATLSDMAAGTKDAQVAANADDCYRRLEPSSWDVSALYDRAGDYNASNYDFSSGLRFLNVTVPKGATITAAYLTFHAYAVDGAIPTTYIDGDDEDNCATFSTAADYDARPRTTAAVAWTPAAWVGGTWYNSASIVAVIQEIVNRAGWISGNALALFWRDAPGWGGISGYLEAYSWDNNPSLAPKLHIEWAAATLTYASIEQADPLSEIFNIIEAESRDFTVGGLAVLWTLSEVPCIQPTLSRVFWAQCPNPDSPTDAVGVNAWTTPAATTDYTANSQAGGGGTNMTGSIGVAVVKLGNTMKITLTNNGAVPAYITLLQARGTPVTVSDPIKVSAEDSASQTAYGKRTYANPAKWMPNTGEADNYCQFVLSIYKSPIPVLTITYNANRDANHMAEALARDVSDRITIVATNTAGLGINQDFFVEAIRHKVDAHKMHWVEYDCSPVSAFGGFFVLDTSRLDTGRLAY